MAATDPWPRVADGTYDISICKQACANDPSKVRGILVVDRTRQAFPEKDAITQSVVDSGGGWPSDYCYFFDPIDPNNAASMLSDAPVEFGQFSTTSAGQDRVLFYLRSPDFRLWTQVASADAQGFEGDWHFTYANDPTQDDVLMPDYNVEARRLGVADSSICYDAIPIHRADDMRLACMSVPELCNQHEGAR